MNRELQLKLQAHMDGELPPGEAREITDLLARDAEARALHAELKNTCAALSGFEAEIKLPEAREFYWSKIRREIQRQEASVEVRREPASPLAWVRRFLVPAGALAVVALVGLVALRQMNSGGESGLAVKTEFADAGALTYRDQAQGMTLVWLPYPAENEFAPAGPDDILQ